ncbi:MAG: hypothetical protein ACYC8T_28080 [Myxococcaceae bacterium]
MGTAKKLLIAACAVIGISLGLAAFAQDEMTPPPPPVDQQEQPMPPDQQMQQQVPAQQLKDLNLTVTKVDKAKGKVWFEGRLAPKALIERNNKYISLDQIKEGDEVRAYFDPTTGEVIKLHVISQTRK